MRTKLLASAFAFMFLDATAMALAGGPQVNSDEIVRKFVDSADLGAKRGICVGTTEECSAQAPKPTGMDMLINFDLNSADLTEQARANLDEFAKALKDDRLRSASFVVEGYTDASGSEIYNDDLSSRRAKSVTAFLLQNGVSQEKIKAVGMGEKNPRVPDPFDPVNRRVEMRIEVQ
jgi:OOP family OmpA-OmpF porin